MLTVWKLRGLRVLFNRKSNVIAYRVNGSKKLVRATFQCVRTHFFLQCKWGLNQEVQNGWSAFEIELHDRFWGKDRIWKIYIQKSCIIIIIEVMIIKHCPTKFWECPANFSLWSDTMTEHLISTFLVIFFKVLLVNKLCPLKFVKWATKMKIWKDICPAYKGKYFQHCERL